VPRRFSVGGSRALPGADPGPRSVATRAHVDLDGAGPHSSKDGASNVIIIQTAERRGTATVGFLEFARVGVPLTLASAVVNWLWLLMLGG
jgi:hypothetical protein